MRCAAYPNFQNLEVATQPWNFYFEWRYITFFFNLALGHNLGYLKLNKI